MTKLSSKTKGVFYIILAAFGFSLMSMFVKLTGDLPSFQKAFFRNFIALIFIFIMMLRDKTGFVPAKKNIPDLFGRCFFGTLGMLCNFYAIGKLNLSDANMLNKLSPFFAIIFSVILLKERPSIVQIAGVCVAFAGSICIIKPGFDNPEVLAAVAGLLGGAGAGIAYTFVRRLGSGKEDSKRIIFWFSAFSCAMCLPFMIAGYKHVSALQFIYLILAGTFACALIVWLITTFLIAPTYESRVSFYVYNNAEKSNHASTINNSDLQAAESLATTYSKILESNSVLDAVLKDLGDKSDLSRKDLSKMIEVSVVSDTQLLEVVIKSNSAEFACDVGKSFANVAPTEIVRITKAGGVEVVDRPEVATEKSSPRTVFDTAIGFLIGVIGISVVLILKMLSDTTIYLPEDIENISGVTVLGQIPEIDVTENEHTYWKLTKGGVIRCENKKDKDDKSKKNDD